MTLCYTMILERRDFLSFIESNLFSPEDRPVLLSFSDRLFLKGVWYPVMVTSWSASKWVGTRNYKVCYFSRKLWPNCYIFWCRSELNFYRQRIEWRHGQVWLCVIVLFDIKIIEISKLYDWGYLWWRPYSFLISVSLVSLFVLPFYFILLLTSCKITTL